MGNLRRSNLVEVQWSNSPSSEVFVGWSTTPSDLTRIFSSSAKSSKSTPEAQELDAMKPMTSEKTVKLNRRVDLFSGIALIVGTMIGA